ncbi:aspartyl/asparaginyl beta-hydroxylase domain-containing protein [Acidisoma cellulosilytica]|uniref:Aspartyl/asparaginyl beta-hydroxylase domain-containing protein n=1 Tax=Acidisoma cellulosilyticum TaxID=2802395 RepID=A0A963Z0V8_9PROT|nr:aspartyl/asparaginyl beta-hydroxylase domain-containing protein [Acidisoma cellulosilyticum]MCB8880464.1 aspartyl/asparaginyl beta-hydroxylase domain-containing protein [Acidisoma cellulosilyticum]
MNTITNNQHGAVAPADAQEAQQNFGTVGIKPMGRPSLTTRVVMKVVSWVEKLNLSCAKLGNPPVYDNETFPWAAEIEKDWHLIRVELDRLLLRKEELPSFHDISTDVSTISTDNGWKTFFLTGYGLTSANNTALCPDTWRIVQKIPGLQTAMFSIFEPGKHLPAHRGPYNGVLRFHLGLKVPNHPDKIAIRVDQQICNWQEGRALIFDDAFEHEAWNHSDETRVVLFVDFNKPLRFPANLISAALLRIAIFTPFIKEGADNHNEWEKKFYAEAEALRNAPAKH